MMLTRSISKGVLALSAGLFVAAGGCGSKSDYPDTVPVYGLVSYNGAPVTRGTITFVSAEGHSATGQIESDGSYRLSTFAPNDGAVPGSHRVMIVADTSNPNLIPGSSPGYEAPQDLVPAKYKDVNTSGLTAEVSAEKPEITFDLE